MAKPLVITAIVDDGADVEAVTTCASVYRAGETCKGKLFACLSPIVNRQVSGGVRLFHPPLHCSTGRGIPSSRAAIA